ncbi:MAG: hypothetical protein MSA72_03350 [Lachnospiraceae bacterium]|nr:hypothetical protein [Lachnospiraceae bacterium]
MVGLGETVENLPDGIHAPCTENLFSQRQLHRTVISVFHCLYGGEHNPYARFMALSFV